MFPPAASNVLIATSLETPRSIKILIFCSECVLDVCRGGAEGLVAVIGAGADPKILPPPGKDDGVLELEEEGLAVSGSSAGFLALSGSSCSERN